MADTAAALVIQLSADYRQFKNEMRAATGVFDAEGRKIERRQQQLRKRLESSWAGFGRSLVPSLGAIGAALSAREIIQYADAWTDAGNKIAASGTSLDEQGERLKQLADLAVNTRSSFDQTVTSYSRMQRSTEGLGKSQQDLLRYVETINKAFVAGGAAASERAAGTLQLTQAIGSGILGGDELRSVRENAPLIAKAIADAMGVGIGDLKELGAQGKISVDVILRALEQLAPKVDEQFSKTESTVSAALTNLETRFTQFVGGISGSGGAGLLASSINAVADNLEDLTKAAAIAAAALAPGGLALGARGAMVAIGTLWAVMAANPIGAVVSVLTAAATALILYQDKIHPATKAIADQKIAHDQLNRVMDTAKKNGEDLTKAQSDKAKATLAAAAATLKEAEAISIRNIREKERIKSQATDPYSFAKGTGANTYHQAEIDREKKELAEIQGLLKQNASDRQKLLQAKIKPPLPPPPPPPSGGSGGKTASDRFEKFRSIDTAELRQGDIYNGAVVGMTDQEQRNFEAQQGIITSGQREIDQYQEQILLLGKIKGEAAAAVFKQRALNQLAQEFGEDSEAYRLGAEQVEYFAEAIKKAADESADAQEQFERAARISDEIRDGMEEVGVAALHGFGSAREALGRFLEQLAEAILRMYVLKPLIEGITGGDGTAIGGSRGGGGILGGLISGFGGGFFDLGGISPVHVTSDALGRYSGAYAKGGRMPLGSWGIVGEAGPEAVMSTPHGAMVMPNSALRMPRIPDASGRGSAPVSVSFQVDARGAQEGVAEQIDQKLRAVAPYIVEAAVKQSRREFPENMATNFRDRF